MIFEWKKLQHPPSSSCIFQDGSDKGQFFPEKKGGLFWVGEIILSP